MGNAVIAGRYELGPLLGTGGMSTVYRARDTVLGRDVALKLFDRRIDAHGPDRERAEMRTLAALSHPSLVTIHDAGTDTPAEGDARAFLVMSLVDGPSLSGLMRSGKVGEATVRRVGAGVAQALAYIHGRGVVHRDVKPANILLDAQHRPHLADFGIAKTLGEHALTATGLTLGTAAYLSPEQVRGVEVGPPTDVYALGLVLLEALTGRREYPGTDAEAALARLSRPPVIDADLPAPWPTLLAGMTADDAAVRPSALEVAAVLEAAELMDPTQETFALARSLSPPTKALTTHVPLPAPPRRTAGTARPRWRAPWSMMVVAGAAALLLVALVVAMVSGSGAPAAPTTAPAPTPTAGHLDTDLARLQQLVTP